MNLLASSRHNKRTPGVLCVQDKDLMEELRALLPGFVRFRQLEVLLVRINHIDGAAWSGGSIRLG